ncbi:MAG: hypothetical protein KAI72_01555 [Candidatus Pacebacteria bacterium]|nr:hypothetical protein [Candidatus Paceibacterota bacterium]
MFKKILFIVILVLFSVKSYSADLNYSDILEKLPPLKQGVAYSFLDNELNYTSTLEIWKYKDVSIEAGYNSKDAIIGAVAIDLIAFEDYTTIPILDLINVDIRLYAGIKRVGISEGNSEFDCGVGFTILRIEK